MSVRRRVVTFLSLFTLLTGVVVSIAPVTAVADHTADPVAVTIVGSLQDELGCPGDWQPDCAATHLFFDAANDVWQATFSLPAGSYEYKAAIDNSWDENYGANAASNGPNIELVLAVATDVKFYYDHKSHWVTDDANSAIATVAGSFQSTLGCSGDWQPWCLRSWMQDVDGNGIYTFATDSIPAGDYEFKVALDENWAVAYPEANVAFSVAAGSTVAFTYDTATNDVTVDAGVPTIEPGDELLVQPPVRIDAQDNVFYFVMPDRFDNGDPGNDSGGDLSGAPLVNGLLPTDKGYYHGGDLAGLAARLPYLDALGVTAIWLTPQFTNRWVQGDGTIGGSSAGYHGYWQIDYSSIDPHFGSNAEMQGFVSSAHALGIDVFFDIVANHTGDVITYVEGDNPTYVSKADAPYLDASGVSFDDADFAGTGTFPPLDAAVSFPYTPTFASGDDTVKFPDFLDDPTLYHNRGESTFSGENSLYGDFVGLDDLWTEHPTVQDGLIQVFKDMVTDFDVDGFRIDTVKHVNDEFWEAFGPELRAHAESLGKADFFMFGEIFNFDVQALSRFSTELPLDAVLDFAFQGSARNFASQNGATDNLANFYAADDYYTDSDSNAYSLPLFLGNHDMGRIGLFLNQDNPGASDAELVARDELAHALMYFGRGMPVVYYGDEQGFVGDGGDQDARQDMMPSVVDTYNDDVLIGTVATTADDNFDDLHPLYQTLSDFSTLLAAHPALARGAQLHRYSQGSAGIYAFSRIERTEQVEYVVALNNSEAAASATFDTDSPGTTFTEVWPGDGPAITSDGSGDVTVDVPALSVKLYRADAPIPGRSVGIHVSLDAPGEGEEVIGQVEVGASLAENRYAEVTFAVSVNGAAFEPIGTDDNAPYRVFYDVSGLATGTPLAFKAIVDDGSGNLSSDKGTAVVGTEEPPGTGSLDYAIVHYNRPAGDYGDHTTGDFTDFWGLHLWGDAINPSEVTDWPSPKPFEGEDEFGRFAWIRRGGSDSQVNFVIHQGDTKDTPNDRFFDADAHPEVWINQGDGTVYTTQADAQGYVTIRYHRDDGDYGDPTSPDYNNYWGLHLWGDAIDPSEGTGWTSPKPPTGIDDYGAFWHVQIVDSSQPVNYIIHRGDTKDPGPDESFNPADAPTVWKQSGDEEIYPSRAAAEGYATVHYHREDGDYGDNTSPDFNDFWGMHVWSGALNPNPSWTEPVRWVGLDVFGPVFEVDLVDGTPELAYIIHRGDQKDPGPDQFLALGTWGHEVWQLSGESPSDPTEPHYVLPVRGEAMEPNRLPVADANGPYTGAEGSPVSLDGTGSTDPDAINGDSIVAYEWDLDNDGEFDDATGAAPSYAFGDDGVYPVGLRVTDSFGATDTDVATVTVSNAAPTVGDPAINPQPSVEGDAVTASAAFTDPGFDDAPFSCSVDHGDGSAVQPGVVTGDTCTGPPHVYADNGTYAVEVTVTDKDGGEGSATTTHGVANAPPVVTVDVESQTVQYSDHIGEVIVTATDVPDDSLAISLTWSADGGASTAGLPGALSVTDEGCALTSIRTCHWSLTGQVTEPEGVYTVAATVEDGDGGATTVEAVITVLAEDAVIEFGGENPVAVEVATPGGDSALVSLTVDVTETVPDLATAAPAFGDIGLADVSMTLSPVGPGSPSTGTCVSSAVEGSGYNAVLPVTCDFDDVPVNTYTVVVTVDGGYYDGHNEDVLVVYDPSLGFTTGGGWFYWPGTDDKTNFGYTVKYNKKGKEVNGNFLLIRHTADGSTYRVKSNALYGLALGEADGFGWASFSGQATYSEPGWLEAIGNHEYVVYVEDHGQPGDGDRVWLEMHDKARDVIPSLSMDREATDNATAIGGGNIVVHH